MTQPTILIVDDSPENLSVLGELLRDDYRVRAANSGVVALRLAALAPTPDLIVLDVMMPGMDGYEVLDRLRADPVTREVPVIFATSLDAAEDEEKGLSRGAVDYITKPLRPAVVLARLSTHLELKRVRDQLKAHNIDLEAQVEARMGENVVIQDVSILALAHLAEIRDTETGNHLRRTQEYVRCLANGLRDHPRFCHELDDEKIKLLAKSAPLHDIGKVGIPDDILRKPGKLDADEWTVMKTHAALGAEAIEDAEREVPQKVAFLDIAKQIARHHHERWDGTGYPDGLAGDAIPLSARLMALADVFDALISRRCYKEPFAVELARSMIVEQRGKQFDPDVCDAFTSAFDEFCAIADRYVDNQALVDAKHHGRRLGPSHG
ncbi:MAG: response regulator [Burkholderiales bacterium]|nr:response regulator [Burkholderiales bacterium]